MAQPCPAANCLASLGRLRQGVVIPAPADGLGMAQLGGKALLLVRMGAGEARDGEIGHRRQVERHDRRKAEATDEQLLDAMAEHPILIERPFVVTDKGTRLARPIDAVREIL